jgi:hypothetical protein
MLAYPMIANAFYLQHFNSMGEFQRANNFYYKNFF